MGKIITLQDYTIEEIQSFCGPNEENIALLEDEFHVDITIRGNEIHLSEENEKLQSVIGRLLTLAKKNVRFSV